jgi:hypothetical protein
VRRTTFSSEAKLHTFIGTRAKPPFLPAPALTATAVTLGILVSASAALTAMDSASSNDPSAFRTRASTCRTQQVLCFWIPSCDMSRAAPAP